MNHLPLSDVDFLSEEDRYCCNCVVIMIENIEINLNFFYCFNPDLFVLWYDLSFTFLLDLFTNPGEPAHKIPLLPPVQEVCAH